MNLAPYTLAELPLSPLAVPPLARRADLSLDEAGNRALVRHMEQGGLRTLLYGGNANLYHQRLDEFEPMLELLADAAGPQTWVIPSIGPDFGKMQAQAEALRRHRFATAMVLPMQPGFVCSEGLVDGLQRIADAAGIPLTLYLRSESTVTPAGLQTLVDGGQVWCVKYAIGRADATQDDRYLSELVDRIGAHRIVSGMGERPVLGHVGRVGRFGLPSFTTGSGCIAPRACLALLAALQAGDAARAAQLHAGFMPLEDLREAHSLVRVLHDAVSWSGVADMGAQLPLLGPTPEALRPSVSAAARTLLAAESGFSAAA